MEQRQGDNTQVAPTDTAAEVPPRAPYANHGRTRAAWALVVGVTLGAIVIGVGMYASLTWLMAVGAAVMAGGVIVSLVLRAMGHGQPLLQADSRSTAP